MADTFENVTTGRVNVALSHTMNTLPLYPRARVLSSVLGITLLASLVGASAAETNAAFSYLAYRFAPEEGWRLRASGNGGSTRLEGRVLQFDFTEGASAVGLGLPDRMLLGRPEKIRLRVGVKGGGCSGFSCTARSRDIRCGCNCARTS